MYTVLVGPEPDLLEGWAARFDDEINFAKLAAERAACAEAAAALTEAATAMRTDGRPEPQGA